MPRRALSPSCVSRGLLGRARSETRRDSRFDLEPAITIRDAAPRPVRRAARAADRRSRGAQTKRRYSLGESPRRLEQLGGLRRLAHTHAKDSRWPSPRFRSSIRSGRGARTPPRLRRRPVDDKNVRRLFCSRTCLRGRERERTWLRRRFAPVTLNVAWLHQFLRGRVGELGRLNEHHGRRRRLRELGVPVAEAVYDTTISRRGGRKTPRMLRNSPRLPCSGWAAPTRHHDLRRRREDASSADRRDKRIRRKGRVILGPSSVARSARKGPSPTDEPERAARRSSARGRRRTSPPSPSAGGRAGAGRADVGRRVGTRRRASRDGPRRSARRDDPLGNETVKKPGADVLHGDEVDLAAHALHDGLGRCRRRPCLQVFRGAVLGGRTAAKRSVKSPPGCPTSKVIRARRGAAKSKKSALSSSSSSADASELFLRETPRSGAFAGVRFAAGTAPA